MVVDPSKISLKGLFLDPAPDTVSETTGQPGNTVGGTRHIFSNGVMAAKIYLGFSYSASSGDSSTVQDIVDWLAANAEMRLAGDNNTDMGPLPDKGWQFWTADPNGGKYVYDNQVVVPPQEENFNQAPGNAIWHMPFYLRGPKDSTEGANVYLCFSDGSKTASTLADQLMTIECSKWGLSSDNFHIRNIKDGIIFSLEYNPDNVPAINPADASKIYYLDKDWYQRSYLCPWVSQDDPNEAPLGCGSLYTSDSDRTYIFQGVFFIIACRYASSTVALIGSGNPVDWNVINRNNSRPNAGILYNYQSRYYFPVNYNEDGQDSTQLLRFYNFSKIDYDPNTVNGPLIMRQYKAYADYFNSVSGFYIGPVDVHPVITDKRDTLVRCGDSFGNLLEIKMRWSTGDDTYPSEQWSIQNVSIV